MTMSSKKISFYKVIEKNSLFSFFPFRIEGYFDFCPNQLEISSNNIIEYKKYVISIWFFLYSFCCNLNREWNIELFKKHISNFLKNNYNFSYEEIENVLNAFIKQKLFTINGDTIIFENLYHDRDLSYFLFIQIEYKEAYDFIKNINNFLTLTKDELLKFNKYFYDLLKKIINLSISNNSLEQYQDFFKRFDLDSNYSKYIFLQRKIFDIAKIDVHFGNFIKSNYNKEITYYVRKFFNLNTSHIYLKNSKLMKNIEEFKSDYYAKDFYLKWNDLFKKLKQNIWKSNYDFWSSVDEIPIVFEDKFLSFFLEYKISYDLFHLITNLDETSYNYLLTVSWIFKNLYEKQKIKLKSQKLFISEIWQNLDEKIKDKIKNSKNKYIIPANDEFLKNKNILKESYEYIVQKQNHLKISEIRDFLFNKFNLNDDINLFDRKIESFISRQPNIIFSRNKTVRYFDFEKVNWDTVIFLIRKISESKEGIYNIDYFYKKFNEILLSIDIQNKYEFHNFLKQTINQNPNINLLKMPIVAIKCNDKDKFFNKIIKEFDLTKNEFYNKLIKEYGFDKLTAVSTINYDFYKNLQITYSHFDYDESINFDNDVLISIKKMIKQEFKNISFFEISEYENFLKKNELSIEYKDIKFLDKLGFYIYNNKYICNKNFNLVQEIKDIINSKGIYKNELSMFYNQKRSLQSCLQNIFKFLDVIQIKEEYVVSYKFFEEKSNINLQEFILNLNNHLSKYDESNKYFLLNNLLEEINYQYILNWIEEIWLIKFICRKNKMMSFEKLDNKYILKESNAISFKNKLSSIVKESKYISLKELEKIICETFKVSKVPFDITKLNFQNMNIYYLKDIKMFFASLKDKQEWFKIQIRKKYM